MASKHDKKSRPKTPRPGPPYLHRKRKPRGMTKPGKK